MIDFLKSAVSIIILNWNGKDDSVECLESLYRNDYPFFRIILVDNASDDGIVEYVEEHFPNVTIIKNEQNLGFAEGNNVGIRYALEQQNPDYVLLLNNDTVVDPSFLTKLVAIGEKYPEVGMLSPVIYWQNPRDRIWFTTGEVDWSTGYPLHPKIPAEALQQYILRRQQDYWGHADYLTGCALLVKTDVIRQIGLLDARFFAYCEDVDWCLRCTQAGWKLAVVPSAMIWHKISASAGTDFSYFLSYRNVILLLWKHSTLFQFLRRIKHYLYRTLAEYSWDREQYYAMKGLTRLDGVWGGLRGEFGQMSRKMPAWLNIFIYRNIRFLLWVFGFPENIFRTIRPGSFPCDNVFSKEMNRTAALLNMEAHTTDD